MASAVPVFVYVGTGVPDCAGCRHTQNLSGSRADGIFVPVCRKNRPTTHKKTRGGVGKNRHIGTEGSETLKFQRFQGVSGRHTVGTARHSVPEQEQQCDENVISVLIYLRALS